MGEVGNGYRSKDPSRGYPLLFRRDELHEQAFRFNNRIGVNDRQRFEKALSQVAGKRLTYAELTGKVGETAAR